MQPVSVLEKKVPCHNSFAPSGFRAKESEEGFPRSDVVPQQMNGMGHKALMGDSGRGMKWRRYFVSQVKNTVGQSDSLREEDCREDA